ncbi:restriction endonuclease subunit S [uncultured Prevotella sp.]|uniref:restriction endonuclease subunit S n=1 Tax=uncultured Prevotella sp. TaxID=159272 RepID=UPI00262CFEF4|nr:restriction endonuclease subunit S [uncultured Prevotella sp.]
MELTTYKKKRIIPKDWKEIKLGEEFKTSSGATPLSTKREYYEGGTISWINSGELDSPFIYKAANFITQKGFDNSSTTIYPQDTILVAMYGATAGKASLLKMEACTNQAICAILPNKDYSPEFIKYNLDTLYDHLVGLSSGSARDNLSQAGIKELKLIVPQTKREQESLVTILSLIDKKIELNRQINDNLEAMAKQLYDYWFVQFDFPNEEGKPYKSSGGAMVWNEKLKREIPQGWTVAKIKDVAQTYSGGTPTSTNSEYYDGGDIPWINSGELNNPIITSTTNYITEEGLNNSSAKLYPQDTVLVALYGATAGKVSLLSLKACSNQAVCGVIPQNKIMTTYIRYYLSSLYEHFITLSSGSARDNISQDTIKNTILPIPQGKILKEFSDAVAPLISKIIANQKEMENLTKQRDELLLLLMNGQASINYHLSDD